MGVAQKRWMVYNGKSYLQMDDLGYTPILGNLRTGPYWSILDIFYARICQALFQSQMARLGG